MGLTERHWFENEDAPENYEWALEDAVYNSRTNKKHDDDIVRCKDCKYWLPMNRFDPDYHPGRGQCELNCWVRDFFWFCGDGERR